VSLLGCSWHPLALPPEKKTDTACGAALGLAPAQFCASNEPLCVSVSPTCVFPLVIPPPTPFASTTCVPSAPRVHAPLHPHPVPTPLVCVCQAPPDGAAAAVAARPPRSKPRLISCTPWARFHRTLLQSSQFAASSGPHLVPPHTMISPSNLFPNSPHPSLRHPTNQMHPCPPDPPTTGACLPQAPHTDLALQPPRRAARATGRPMPCLFHSRAPLMFFSNALLPSDTARNPLASTPFRPQPPCLFCFNCPCPFSWSVLVT
jgi:hypothetical protein